MVRSIFPNQLDGIEHHNGCLISPWHSSPLVGQLSESCWYLQDAILSTRQSAKGGTFGLIQANISKFYIAMLMHLVPPDSWIEKESTEMARNVYQFSSHWYWMQDLFETPTASYMATQIQTIIIHVPTTLAFLIKQVYGQDHSFTTRRRSKCGWYKQSLSHNSNLHKIWQVRKGDSRKSSSWQSMEILFQAVRLARNGI